MGHTTGDIRARFASALDKNMLNESVNLGIDNEVLLQEIKSIGKESQFELYLNNLSITGGKSFSDTVKLLNGFKSKDAKEFATNLAKYKSIEDLASNFTKHKSGLGDVIFDEARSIGKGIGPGELWIAWLVEGARVSGGGESFDITVNNKEKYEVKSYIGDNSPFRLGNAGAASKFEWLRHMGSLAAATETITSTPSLEKAYSKLFKAAVNVNSRSGKSSSADFARGEISKTLLTSMLAFIKVAKEATESRKSGYDIIEVKSTQAGLPNKTYNIEPATDSQIASGSFKIIGEINTNDLNSETILFRELVKNKYVREGAAGLVKDINTGIEQVETKYKGIKFLVFRKGKMNITSNLVKVKLSDPYDLPSVYGDAESAVFNMSGALLRVREEA